MSKNHELMMNEYIIHESNVINNNTLYVYIDYYVSILSLEQININKIIMFYYLIQILPRE